MFTNQKKESEYMRESQEVREVKPLESLRLIQRLKVIGFRAKYRLNRNGKLELIIAKGE